MEIVISLRGRTESFFYESIFPWNQSHVKGGWSRGNVRAFLAFHLVFSSCRVDFELLHQTGNKQEDLWTCYTFSNARALTWKQHSMNIMSQYSCSQSKTTGPTPYSHRLTLSCGPSNKEINVRTSETY